MRQKIAFSGNDPTSDREAALGQRLNSRSTHTLEPVGMAYRKTLPESPPSMTADQRGIYRPNRSGYFPGMRAIGSIRDKSKCSKTP